MCYAFANKLRVLLLREKQMKSRYESLTIFSYTCYICYKGFYYCLIIRGSYSVFYSPSLLQNETYFSAHLTLYVITIQHDINWQWV